MRNSALIIASLVSLFFSMTHAVGAPPRQPGAPAGDSPAGDRPNIVWVVIEDASPHIGCYGEPTIETPHIDALANDGVQFTNAIVTNPVCSPSRSAMVTGMYQTTLGAHHHRSQGTSQKRRGNTAYYDSYRLPVSSVPELFKENGYYVTSSGLNKDGKTDYNFIAPDLYEPGDWRDRKAGQPFFAQIQLHGGKARRARVEHPVDPKEVTLPPYYPDDPVLRDDWAAYLNSWIKTDKEVGEVVQRLRDAGVLDQTVIFLWTDHGVSHVRGKQFLYDEGIRIPLIARFEDRSHAGTVREDPVEHIDVAAASLALAGIPIPDYVQGRDIFAEDYQPREYTFAARDRCDETVDIIRCVRTERYKYIRNFMSHVPHAQPNQYKDGKGITQRMRTLHRKGKLNELQARVFKAPRPAEELYDLEADPHETVNLAEDPAHRQQLDHLRGVLYEWMVDTRDLGLIPEPVLEDLGRKHGNKYHVLSQPENAALLRQLIDVIEAGEREETAVLQKALTSGRPSVRYWAATWLAVTDETSVVPELKKLADDDPVPAVRIAAALALCKLGHEDQYVPVLASHVTDDNLIAGMYAIRALERVGRPAEAALPVIKAARKSPYEFTRRYARRLTQDLTN